MKHTRHFLFSLLLIWLSACGQSPENKSHADWKTLDENGYSIQYPNDWGLDESGLAGTSFILFSENTSEEDEFLENVNLLIQNLKGRNIDLQEFVKISEEQIGKLVTNGKIIESETLGAKNKKFHSIVYSGDQGEYKLIYKQYYWIKYEQAYLLTLTCEANQFETYIEVGEQIMNTFKIK